LFRWGKGLEGEEWYGRKQKKTRFRSMVREEVKKGLDGGIWKGKEGLDGGE